MYKAKLQELSHEKRWGLPRYTAMKDGPDHQPHFKASVYVNGLSFHSPTISTSLKQAHNQAAKLAFLHFVTSSGSSTVATETMAEGQNIEEPIQSSEIHSIASAVTNCSLKPRAEQDARGSNIGEKYQCTEIHSHALAFKDGCSTPRDEKPKTGETNHNTETHSHASSVSDGENLQDLQYQYKSQLQNYARSKNLDAPLYSSKRDGPPHAFRFQARVTIDGHTFESPEFFNTLKKAEHAAAKVALMSLLQNDFQEDDSGFYKNVLRELAQKQLFCIPTYETFKCGPSHMPTFFSTVEVDGEIFYGKAGKSKKQAEMKAAKVAHTAFKDRALRRRNEFTSPDSPAHEVLKSSAISVQVITVDSQQKLKPQHPLLSSPAIDYEEHAEERKDSTAGEAFNSVSSNEVISVDSEKYVIPGCSLLSSLPVNYEEHAKERKDEVQEADSAEILSASADATNQDTYSSPVILDTEKMNTKRSSTACSESVPVTSKEDSFSMTAPLDLSASSTEMTTREMSYLLCGRIRVYPCFPEVSFPKGITVLPISEDKWVAMSLEFPNEKGN